MLNFSHQQEISLLQNKKFGKKNLCGLNKLFNVLFKKLSPKKFFGHEFL